MVPLHNMPGKVVIMEDFNASFSPPHITYTSDNN